MNLTMTTLPNTPDFTQQLAPLRHQVDAALESLWQRLHHQHAQRWAHLPQTTVGMVAPLWEGLRYVTTQGGKRFRPLLCLATAHTVVSQPATASPWPHANVAMGLALALELIHVQSLILDDLPALDNDELRRGQPTLHVVQGEAMALMAADALALLAPSVLVRWGDTAADTLPETLAANAMRVIERLGLLASVDGLVNGQVADLLAEQHPETTPPEATLAYIHANKTGALLEAACVLPAVLLGASSQQQGAFTAYGRALGLLFQATDDWLDAKGDAATLGKTLGKDAEAGKLTLWQVYPTDEAFKTHVASLATEAQAALASLQGCDTSLLQGFITYGWQRCH
jgi:geranylgeranyl pyrophosphate synthase